MVVPLGVKKGTRAVTQEVAVTADGKAYALVFHDHAKGVEVGKSAVEGHFGHHDMAFDAEKQFGFFTNPGDGTLSVRSLKSLDVVTTFKVGGTPTAIVALGKRETDD